MVEPSQARLLAPVALVAFAIAFLVVIVTSGGGSGGSRPPVTAGTTAASAPPAQPPRPAPRSYVVRPGDFLGSIAQRTGVPVQRLLELNPGLDPQALVPGQRIKLRP